jgi:hypothetical protein
MATPVESPSTPKAPQTPASGTGTPTGRWRHPHLDEINRRVRKSTFNDSNVNRIVWNALSLLATIVVPHLLHFVLPSLSVYAWSALSVFTPLTLDPESLFSAATSHTAATSTSLSSCSSSSTLPAPSGRSSASPTTSPTFRLPRRSALFSDSRPPPRPSPRAPNTLRLLAMLAPAALRVALAAPSRAHRSLQAATRSAEASPTRSSLRSPQLHAPRRPK